jgi:ATP-dependent DNA helicase RecG
VLPRDEAIREPEALPQFHVDYRDKTAVEPGVRWEDRITVGGQWVANLFQFYRRVIVRLTSDLRVPFRLEPDLFRKDDTPVHEAVREALVNALIHADYRGQGGVVIDRYRSRIEMSNPRTLLVSSEQLLRGAVGECRNKSPRLMFQMMGAGGKAGPGFDKIRRGRKSRHWRQPYPFGSAGPGRVILGLPMVRLLPPESLNRLQAMFGGSIRSLSPVEVQTLVAADLEDTASNARMRLLRDDHTPPPREVDQLPGLQSDRPLDHAVR